MVGTLVSVSLLILFMGMLLYLPDDLFLRISGPSRPGRMALAIRFFAGLLLAGTGVILSLPGVPGPGLILILLGLFLMGFLNREKLVALLKKYPVFLNTLNRLRGRFGRAPLKLPPSE
ncbi:MAG: hypothetical protein ACYCYP_09065 [Leptospirales bacterium]